jgi:glycosyltransferase involved in cell wall biosynthesis
LAAKLKRDGLVKRPVMLPNCIDWAPYSNAVSAEGFSVELPETGLRIVSVSRVCPEKRQIEIIAAARELDPAEDWQLVIAGDGPSLAQCRDLAREYKLTDHIVFTGGLNREQVAEVLRRSDVFVLGSNGFDNQPMAVLEALAAGLPIVYCDPLLEEGLTSANALLTEPEPQALGLSITHIFSSPHIC